MTNRKMRPLGKGIQNPLRSSGKGAPAPTIRSCLNFWIREQIPLNHSLLTKNRAFFARAMDTAREIGAVEKITMNEHNKDWL